MTNSDKPDSVTESVQAASLELQTGSPAMRIGWWVLFALGLLAIGVIGAVLSVKLRRTQTAQTSVLFGPQAIAALESSTAVRLHLDAASGLELSSGFDTTQPGAEKTVDLTDIPGVGHLRHALLDQRHYDWTTQQAEEIDAFAAAPQTKGSQAAEWVTLELDGTPPRHAPIEPTRFKLELTEGWVGIPGGNGRVRLRPRVARALRNQVLMMSNVRATRADQP